MKILKFGGTSVGTIESFKQVLNIICEKHGNDKIAVVVSAIGGITDKLIKSVELAAVKDTSYKTIVEEVKMVHYKFLVELINKDHIDNTKQKMNSILLELEKKLTGIYLIEEYTDRLSDSVISMGELLSKTLMVSALKSRGVEAEDFEAAEFIKTNSHFGNAEVDFEISNKIIQKKFKDLKREVIPIVNGFTGSNQNGHITTLGRSGSDYTATIIAGAIDADSVEIWTDVDGILSADPRIVSEAKIIKEINYNDAAELAFLGAKVIFPKAMEPVKSKNIPINVLNTFNTAFEGTVICERIGNFTSEIISITSLNNLSLVSLSDITEEINYSVLTKVINRLNKLSLPIISLNHSLANRAISILTYSQKISRFIDNIREELKPELEHKAVKNLSVLNNISLVTIIGNKTDNQPETFKKISDTLERLNIDSLTYLSGTEGKNYSFLMDKIDTSIVIAALHETFFTDSVNVNVA
jgi:aspartokinase/homoserine dehydrogenase 1